MGVARGRPACGFGPPHVLGPATEPACRLLNDSACALPAPESPSAGADLPGGEPWAPFPAPELTPGRTGIADQVGEHQHRYLLPVDSLRSLMPEADNIYQSFEIMSGV